ncbi:MAG: TIGR04255 family protein [Opitutaceae bacterium]
MGAPPKIEIRVDAAFPHLDRAPITEAVLELRTLAEAPWEETEIQPKLQAALPDYPTFHTSQRIKQAFAISPGQPPQQTLSDLGWQGLQFQSADSLNLAGFYRESFVFSRQRPYTDWARFTGEAFRLWEFHVSLAQPSEIQRAGLRFINQVELDSDEPDLSRFLRFPPRSPEGLGAPFNFFFHQDNLTVPGHRYSLTLNRALQPKQDLGGGKTISAKLILDIDVGTTVAIGLEQLRPCLAEMRWLKNKAFFGSFTEAAINAFKK